MDARLKVYYGWARTNKVRKKRSLSVMFENSVEECRNDRGRKTLSLIQETVFERYQSEGEAEDSRCSSRIFTGYDLMLDEKPVNSSLDRLLELNSQADRFNVSAAERKKISEALRKAFMVEFPDYEEPTRQLKLNFEEL